MFGTSCYFQPFLLVRNDLVRGVRFSKRGLCFSRSLVACALLLQWGHHSLAFKKSPLLVTGGLLYGFPRASTLDWLIGITVHEEE
jgi:hypothetical protein